MSAARRSRMWLGTVLVPLMACSGPPAGGADPLALMAEVDRLAGYDLWPGFEARAVPVAIYDGERTFLFRHPNPPDEFARIPEQGGVRILPGRHPEVTANTVVELGGVLTATLLPPSDYARATERAGLLLHEAFHVFQREHHPAWTANEAELFTYPVDSASLLAMRRLETEALRLALAAEAGTDGHDEAACWSRTALETRRERFMRLSAGAAAYERGTELNEGLATYVEYRALSRPDSDVLRHAAFAPEEVRAWSYRTGLALARLLDRFAPEWRTDLSEGDSPGLDALLDEALEGYSVFAGQAPAGPGCGFTDEERRAVQSAAIGDVEALRIRRDSGRRAFLEEEGWRIILVASASPLLPQGFDPLNVQALGSGEVLHTRFLRLGNEAAFLEVLGQAALTEAAGSHPLFNGVRRVTITGLPAEPRVDQAAGIFTIEAEGVRAEASGAALDREGRTVTVRLPGS